MQTFILSVMTVAVFFFDDTNFVISSILHVRNYPCLPCTKNKHSVIILKCIFVKIIQILLIINIPLISKNFITNIIVDQNMLTKVYYFPTRFSICLFVYQMSKLVEELRQFRTSIGISCCPI